MVKLKEISYKRSISKDGSLFSEGLEITVDATENDNFLDGAQILQLNEVANQIKNVNAEIMQKWFDENEAKQGISIEEAQRVNREGFGGGLNLGKQEPPAGGQDIAPKGMAGQNESPNPNELKPGYNPDRKRWGSCDVCGNKNITHKSKTTNMNYQACFTCRMLLGKNGDKKAMTQ